MENPLSPRDLHALLCLIIIAQTGNMPKSADHIMLRAAREGFTFSHEQVMAALRIARTRASAALEGVPPVNPSNSTLACIGIGAGHE